MTAFVKKHWKLCAVVAVLVLLLLIPRVGQFFAERALRRLDASADVLIGKAAEAQQRAQAAETKAAQIETELTAAKEEANRLGKELATANQRLQQARNATQAARVNYDKVLAQPVPADVDVDLRQLCAELARQGYSCTAKPVSR